VSLCRVVATAALLQTGGDGDDRRCSKGARYIASVTLEQRLAAGSIVDAAVELGRSCNGASSAFELRQGRNGVRSELQWSFVGAALKLRRGCNEARPELQWSFDGAIGAALELCRGCSGARRTSPVLRWSSVGATMAVR